MSDPGASPDPVFADPGLGVLATGIHEASRVITAEELARMTRRPVRDVKEKMGLVEFRLAHEGETPSEMARDAAEQAIEASGVPRDAFDLVIYGYGLYKDYFAWQANAKLIDVLGLHGAYGFDMDNTCNTPLTAWQIVRGWFATEPSFRNALVVTSDTFKDIIDYTSRETSSFSVLGDGAAATVLTRDCERSRILGTHLTTKAEFWDLLKVPSGGAALPPSHETIRRGLHTLRVQKNLKAFRQLMSFQSFRLEAFDECAYAALEKAGKSMDDVSFLLKSQTNRKELLALLERYGLREDQTHELMTHYGHMGPTDLFFSLHLCVQEGRIRPGDLVLMLSVGGGYHFGAALLEWRG